MFREKMCRRKYYQILLGYLWGLILDEMLTNRYFLSLICFTCRVQKDETPKKKKSESLESLKKDGTPKKTKSETLAKLKKLTPKKLKSASLENLKKDGTLKKKKSESIENLKKDEALKKQKSESIENLKEKEPAKKEERVRLEALLAKKQELLEREPEKKEEPPLIMKPNFNLENEKENDLNLVNEQTPVRKEEEEEVAHFIKRCDSKVIYSKYISLVI